MISFVLFFIIVIVVISTVEDQKTEQQKVREQQLLKELLEVMDERERLDQRLTRTTRCVGWADPLISFNFLFSAVYMYVIKCATAASKFKGHSV